MPPSVQCLNCKVEFFIDNFSFTNHFKEYFDPMDVNSQCSWQSFNSPWNFSKHNSICPAIFAEALEYPKPKTPVHYESVSSSVNSMNESDNFDFDDFLFNIDFYEIQYWKKLNANWMKYTKYFDWLAINNNILIIDVDFLYHCGINNCITC